MLESNSKRLAELERRLAASHKHITDAQAEAVWAQYSDDELEALKASVERREQPGYVLMAEDQAIERRWYEVVQATVPKVERVRLGRREWALAWCEVVKSHV
jgi:hypothetical protein